MDNGSMNESRAPVVIVIMMVALSSAIVGGILAGCGVFLLTR